jgi:acyl dehydratase
VIPDLADLRARLVGLELPEGRFRVLEHEAWLHADALGSPALPEGILHPMYVFNAALSGLGIGIEELFGMAGVAMDEGPMGGEMDMRQLRPLRVGEPLTVRGRIVRLDRKHGASGTFDLMTAELTLTDAAGEVVGIVTNGYVLPRRSA